MHTNNSTQRLLTEDLVEELNSADLVYSQETSPDVVTMNSPIELVFDGSVLAQKFTICYPVNVDPSLGFISVLSPVGAALLGRRVGDIVRWQMPHGEARSARVAGILFQPEASGDYTT